MQHLRQLASRRPVRWESGSFVAEGPRMLDEALRSAATVETVYVDPSAATEAHRDLAERARQAGATVLEVQPGVLARACDAVTPQPVASVVTMLHVAPESLLDAGLTVVCVGLQDPGNAGTVLRSASASGSSAVVFCTGAVDIYNPKTVRASAGAIFHLPIVAGVEPEAVLDQLGERGVVRLAATVRGGRDHDAVDWTGSHALLLGSESHGLPDRLDRYFDGRVTIPMDPATESLNVAMAATVVCFEAARQRRAATGTPGYATEASAPSAPGRTKP